MAITVLFGPGGSGKSYYQVLLIVGQLRETKRNVVTNLALDLPRLASYLETKYPGENLRVAERVRVLTLEETKEFWKHRGPWRWIPTEEYSQEYDRGANGVCYIIDEAGAAGFSAQGWASTDGRSPRGVQCSWYLDQQRKFGDDVIASTNGRTPNQIAKAFRDKAHCFVKLRNEYLASYGPFRGRGRFVARHYSEEPSNNSEPFKTETWTMDAHGLASCYRTADGVGVSGTNADKGARAKGISIWWAVVFAFMLCGLVVAAPIGLGKIAGYYLKPKTGSGAEAAPVSRDTEVPGVALASFSDRNPVGRVVPREGSQAPNFAHPTPSPAKEIFVSGYAVRGSRIIVTLTDGRVFTEGDSELVRVDRHRIELRDGSVYFLRRPASDASGTRNSVTPAVTPPPVALTAPSEQKRDGGAWETDSYGVSRLRAPAALGK